MGGADASVVARPGDARAADREGRRARWSRRALRVLAALVALWVLGAVLRPFEPPMIMRGGRGLPRSVDITRLPAAESVELRVGERTLRGYFVPADPGAPVVLHLMGSGLSVMAPSFGYVAGTTLYRVGSFPETLRALSDRGFASLAVDYGGVGHSEGSRDLAEFAEDVRAMWAEAVRRADDDPSRVLLRGTSLGGLAAALLLADGARPRALLLHAPVLAESVVSRFARAVLPAPLPALALPLLGDGLRVDLLEAIRTSGVPTYAVASLMDELLSEEEAFAIQLACFASGGQSYLLDPRVPAYLSPFAEQRLFHHTYAAFLSGTLGAAECEALDAIGPGVDADWRAARARERASQAQRAHFEERADDAAREYLVQLVGHTLHAHPDLLLAAALAEVAHHELAVLDAAWPGRLPPFLDALAPELRVRLLDLADPAGRLPIEKLVPVAQPLWVAARQPARDVEPLALDELGLLLRGLAASGPGAPRLTVTHEAPGLRRSSSLRTQLDAAWWQLSTEACRAAGAGEPDAAGWAAAARRAARLVAKAGGLPDRVVPRDDGTLVLEVWRDDTWQVFEHDLVHAPQGPDTGIARFAVALPPPASAEG